MSRRARVPAKINLQLSVGPTRPDGFHELVSVFHAISLYDEIVVAEGEPGTGIRIIVSGDYVDLVPTTADNLAARAVSMVAARYGRDADFLVQIRKSIPVAAGLAGGSADAAGALLATDALLGNELSRDDLMAMAAQLGSDVPFSLAGGTAVGMGRGEKLTPALARGEFHWVLLADTGLSTPAVYAEFDRLNPKPTHPKINEAVMHALRSGDATALGKALTNDLQAAAISLRPGLSQLLDVGVEYGALGSIVSGSGPTIAFLVRDEEHALDVAVAATSTGFTGAIIRARGPVVGARLGDERGSQSHQH